jgi:hypothetical protein
LTYEQLINWYGGLAATSRSLGLRESTIREWKEYGVPGVWQVKATLDSGGKLREGQLKLSADVFTARSKRKR